MMVRGVGSVAMARGPGRAGPAAAAGFAVAADGPAASARVSAAAGLDGLLLLQEMEDAPARDRRARRHGRAVLDALARLQLGLLGGEPDPATLRTLAMLVEDCPEAAEPGLRDTLAAVALRARVELARHGL